MTNDHSEAKYTDPELRRRLKAEIQQSDKGGKPGQWSARKSQYLVKEYEKQGGGYCSDQKDEAARSLETWSEQDWQTATGEAQADQGDKTQRYLPKAVWDRLSEAEKQEAERTKETASRHGEQHSEWTPAVKRAMHEMAEAEAEAESDSGSGHGESASHPLTKQELYDQAKALNISGRSKMNSEELQTAIDQALSQDKQ